MHTLVEEIKPKYDIGDLIFSNKTKDSSSVGIIIKKRFTYNAYAYQIVFFLWNGKTDIPSQFKNEWWKETVIHSKIICNVWSIQKKK